MKPISKEEYKKKVIQFEKEWLPSIETRISFLKSYVGADLMNKLDYSEESLTFISQLLIEKIKIPENIDNYTNKPLLDAIATYIGEFYIKQFKGLAYWTAFDMQTTGGNYIFDGKIKFGEITTCYPPHHFGYIVFKKDLEKLTWMFKYSYKTTIEEYKPIIPMPGRGGYAYQYFILLRDKSFVLKNVEEALQAYIDKFSKGYVISYYNEKHLLVKIRDDYYFHFSLDETPGLEEESQSIALSYKGTTKDKGEIASCSTRIEFWGDEDPNGDFINIHMSLLDLIISNDSIFIYDFRNSIFYDEM